MNWNFVTYDLNHVRAFYAAATEGSFSAAARALNQTQATLSRQVSGLEKNLGVTLFERGHRNLELTGAGLELLEHARALMNAANDMSLIASGQSQSIEGRVCITATEMMATYYLPSIIKKLRSLAPGIVIDVAASDRLRDLMRREADIAIRHAEPTQLDLVARRIGSHKAQIYASKSLLDEVGRPSTLEDLRWYDFVGIDDTEALVEGLVVQGVKLDLSQFRVNAASGNCMLQLIREGLGFGFLPEDTGCLFEDLEPVLRDAFQPEIPVWLVVHRELHTSRRIRIVFDLLVEELQTLLNSQA
jgi:DNA-binding transcriptional LysR family regulator